METLADIRARVEDILDVESSDTWHTSAALNSAINDVLIQTADRLCGTVARRRYMKRTADLEADGAFNSSTLVWTLPSDFRRPFKLVRDRQEIKEVASEEDFTGFGQDGYLIVGRELWLTATTDPTDLEVWWFYSPARMTADGNTPDFIEGYEAFLALKAAARRSTKGDVMNPRIFHDEADRMWGDLIIAARNSALPAMIRSERGAHGEDWL